jgi:hypothetical protein
MKKTALLMLSLFLVCISVGSIKAQTIKNSFIIHAPGVSQTNIDFYKKSIEAADFEQFRLKTQTVVLKFKNGFNLELIPAKDLVTKKISSTVDINKYSDTPGSAQYKYPLFEILPSGWVTAAVETSNKH